MVSISPGPPCVDCGWANNSHTIDCLTLSAAAGWSALGKLAIWIEMVAHASEIWCDFDDNGDPSPRHQIVNWRFGEEGVVWWEEYDNQFKEALRSGKLKVVYGA